MLCQRIMIFGWKLLDYLSLLKTRSLARNNTSLNLTYAAIRV